MMKKSISLIILTLFLVGSVAWGQTADEWLERGFKAHEEENYDAAIRC